MKKPKRSKIEVRAAELSDAEALTRIYADRNAYSQTLQLPFQSLEVWRKRLTHNDDAHHALVAAVAGEVVGNLGLTRFTRPRRALQPQPRPMMQSMQRALPAQPQDSSGVVSNPPPAPREQPRNYPPARAHGGTKSCSWPMGDPKQSGFHFCGEPSEPGRPYCANHCHQAYQRKSDAA